MATNIHRGRPNLVEEDGRRLGKHNMAVVWKRQSAVFEDEARKVGLGMDVLVYVLLAKLGKAPICYDSQRGKKLDTRQ